MSQLILAFFYLYHEERDVGVNHVVVGGVDSKGPGATSSPKSGPGLVFLAFMDKGHGSFKNIHNLVMQNVISLTQKSQSGNTVVTKARLYLGLQLQLISV